MTAGKSILLYNLYPLNNWRQITELMFANVPHDDIMVHINIPKRNPINALRAYQYLKKYKKVKNLYWSLNFKSKGESIGFNVFRNKIDFKTYDIASYIHSKGSSRKRKDTQPIKDWTELLRYFVVERLDLARSAFENGYYLYGVNLLEEHMKDRAGNFMFPESKFHFSGNFVTINLKELRNEFLAVKCHSHYYGAEVFWGTLSKIEKAFCVHQSNVYHYQDLYPGTIYK